jgi:hypothetical protein
MARSIQAAVSSSRQPWLTLMDFPGQNTGDKGFHFHWAVGRAPGQSLQDRRQLGSSPRRSTIFDRVATMYSLEKKRQYQREWVARKRRDWLEQNGPCVKCGSADRLEIDHKDPTTKVTNSVWSWSAARQAEELSKCQVLCYECHKQKTKIDRRHHSVFPPEHGTIRRYKSKSAPCRCDLCKRANAQSNARWRDTTGKAQSFYDHRS